MNKKMKKRTKANVYSDSSYTRKGTCQLVIENKRWKRKIMKFLNYKMKVLACASVLLCSVTINSAIGYTESNEVYGVSDHVDSGSSLERSKITETTSTNETTNPTVSTDSSLKNKPTEESSTEESLESEVKAENTDTNEKTTSSTNASNEVDNEDLNTKPKEKSPKTKMYGNWQYTETTNNTCQLEVYIPTTLNEYSYVTVPNEIDGKQTEIDLSYGLPVDDIKLYDPPSPDKKKKLVFDNTGNKKVKVISNHIGTLDYAVIDVSGLDISKVTSLAGTFSSMYITNITISGWDTSKVESMNSMFKNAGNNSDGVKIYVDKEWNTSNVKDMSHMFENVRFADLDNFSSLAPKVVANISSVEYMQYMCANVNIRSRLMPDYGSSDDMQGSHEIWRIFKGKNNVVKDMSYMFYTQDNSIHYSPTAIDLTAFTNLNSANIEKMLFVNKNASNFKALRIISNSEKVANYNFKEDNRVPVSRAIFDSNGGHFQDGSLEKVFSIGNEFVYINTPTIQEVIAFSKNNIPEKEGYTFVGWKVEAPAGYTRPVYELGDPKIQYDDTTRMKYKAQWKEKDFNQPSKEDNFKPIQKDSLSIAYMPKLFTIKSQLNDSGKQSIDISKNKSFHIGVRDRTNSKDSWKLQAQLVWTGKSIHGGSLQIKNSGIVKKNLNDGTSPFNPDTDFSSSNNEVSGAVNPSIGVDAPISIMEANTLERNAIYDYELGEMTFEIANTSIVEPGSYTGKVNWNILKAP